MDRRVIDFEVAGMVDDAGGRPDGQGIGILDAMVDMDEFDRESADSDHIAVADFDQLSIFDPRATSSILRLISSMVR